MSVMPRENPETPFEDTCIECGKKFDVPKTEEQFMFKKGFFMPRRCRDCRVKKRKQNNENGRE